MTVPHVIYLVQGAYFTTYTRVWISAWAPDPISAEGLRAARSLEAVNFVAWKRRWMEEHAFNGTGKLKISRWFKALATYVADMGDPWPTPFGTNSYEGVPTFTVERIADDGSHMNWLDSKGRRMLPRLQQLPDEPALPAVYHDPYAVSKARP